MRYRKGVVGPAPINIIMIVKYRLRDSDNEKILCRNINLITILRHRKVSVI